MVATMDFHGSDHGFSWCRPWIFMVPTMDFHGADHGFSWCRPWIFMVSTMEFHSVDHGTSWCRPWIFMVPTLDSHGVDHGFSGCAPWICTLLLFGRDLRPPSLESAVHRHCCFRVEFGFSGFLWVGGGFRRVQMKRFLACRLGNKLDTPICRERINQRDSRNVPDRQIVIDPSTIGFEVGFGLNSEDKTKNQLVTATLQKYFVAGFAMIGVTPLRV
jgi:hypothetical protein